MSRSCDVVVIGAGHNGLTAAAILAKAGRNVVVVESREVVGGLAAVEEFHPGYRCAGVLHDAGGVWPSVVEKLELERHGLIRRRRRAQTLSLAPPEGLLLGGDTHDTAEQIRRHSAHDAEAYISYRAFLDRVQAVGVSFLHEAPLDFVYPEHSGLWTLARRALQLRLLGASAMNELLRLPPMCVSDWLEEWFEGDALKAALALPAIAGTVLGPRSPGSNTNLLLSDAATAAGTPTDPVSLVASLEKAVLHHGGEIRVGTPVRRIETSSSGVTGVVLDSGEKIGATIVAASCDPKRTFLQMLAPGTVSTTLERRIRNFRTRGTTACVRYALSAPVKFAVRAQTVEFAVTGRDLNHLERAHDAAKHRRLPEDPVLEVHLPTVATPGLSPDGGAVASVLVHFVPFDLESGWNDGQRRRLAETVTAILETHAPGFQTSVVGHELLAPPDLEQRYGISGGQIHHGEHALDQRLVRPVPECSRHATPIAGLFLCGAGAHPGGGLTCGPGALGAAAILRG
jgi:phytoene dehydrogenase-like protein